MSKPRPFRFGVSVHGSKSRAEWIGIARQAEALGYSTLLMPDHLGDQLSPVAALVAAADATTTLRVGSLVFDNDFRHPVMLAKEAATLDVLSGGRLELGLGAGWMKPEYERAGIPFERASVRIARMEEAIRIVKGLFADGPVDFTGQYYTVTGCEGFLSRCSARTRLFILAAEASACSQSQPERLTLSGFSPERAPTAGGRI